MKYLFPCIMLVGGVVLLTYEQAVAGVILAFFSGVAFSEILESDKEEKL